MRFLFGAGEAGAWPCVARTFSRWIPQHERGRVQGIFFCGAHLVAGLTPAFIVGGGLLGPWPGMLSVMSWRGVFVTFGLVGLVWVAIWLYWFRNDPSEHPSVSPSELALIVASRRREADHGSGWAYWRTLIRSRNMLALSVMYIPNCMIFYFCITWLPSYLLERHGFNISGMALFAGLPLLVSMPGDLLGGWLTDRLCIRYGLRVGRCGLGGVAYVLVGSVSSRRPTVGTPVLAAVLIAAATGLTMFTLGAAWGTVMEIGGNHVGVVGGTMNSIGNLVAMLNPLIVAYSVAWFGSWDVPLVRDGRPVSHRRRLLGAGRSHAPGVRRGVNPLNQGDCRGTTWNSEELVRRHGRRLGRAVGGARARRGADEAHPPLRRDGHRSGRANASCSTCFTTSSFPRRSSTKATSA